MIGHFSKQISAVSAAHGRHREDIENVGVGEVPVAPGHKAREIGFETRTAQQTVFNPVVFEQQHAAVPQRWLSFFPRRKVSVDLGSPFDGKLPLPRRDSDFYASDWYDLEDCGA